MAFEKQVYTGSITTLHGRQELAVAVLKEELNTDVIKSILETVLPIHVKNVKEINYLKGYLTGKQEILKKTKKVREDINNKIVENNAFHIVEFKKGYEFGDPIQYVQRSETDDKELSLLNAYMIENDKATKDQELAEDLFVSAVGFRIVLPSVDFDKPFVIDNLDNRRTMMVYSTDIHHTRLFGAYIMNRSEELAEIMVYADNGIYYFEWQMTKNSKETPKVKFIKSAPNPLRQIPIFEYKLNKSRIGLIELVKGQLDLLNKITSADIDDIEQYINSLLVFFNQDITKEEFISMVEMGAVMMSDSVGTNLKSDVKLLSNKMLHSETKIFYQRVYDEMLTIAGVPKMSDKSSGGDTGQARLVGEGWIMADERAKQDELAFKLTERQMLKLVLDICRTKETSGIKKLTVQEIEIKFTRNKSDNMLVKSQTLMNLKNAKVPPEVAFTVVGFFSDPAEVVKQAKAYYGDDFWQDEEKVKEVVETFAQE